MKKEEKTDTANNEFIFRKKSPLADDAHRENDLTKLKALRTRFAGLCASTDFFKAELASADADLMGGIALRLDCAERADENTFLNAALSLAEIIDGLSRDEQGAWGVLSKNTMGCFFEDASGSGCEKLAETIRGEFALKKLGTVSTGMAVFPMLDYGKDQLMENALKALDHGAFFGDGSLVVFDSVSMNISGDNFYAKGNYDAAVKEFERALALDPDNANIFNSLGVCHGAKKDYDKAMTAFERAGELLPDDPMPTYNSGFAAMTTDKRDEAMELFKTAYEKSGGDHFESALQLGKLYLEKEDFETAVKYFERAAKIKPDSGNVYRYMGVCEDMAERVDGAMECYQKAVKHNPYDAESLSALGRLFDLKGENPEIAVSFCEQSTAISPENGLFRRRLAKLYMKMNMPEKAMQEFQCAHDAGYDSEKHIKAAKATIKKIENG